MNLKTISVLKVDIKSSEFFAIYKKIKVDIGYYPHKPIEIVTEYQIRMYSNAEESNPPVSFKKQTWEGIKNTSSAQ